MQEGQIIAPSLTLARPLGTGGMSTVWVAHHRTLGREVAVKFLSEELAHDPYAVLRFEREALAVAELKNRHIVDVVEFGFTEAGLPYMATELLEGEDLGERLARDRRLQPDEVATILEQICDALAATHELGIVHRDIKPENIFVLKGNRSSGDQPAIRLLDFGIAKRWQDPKFDVTSTGVVVGTPHYMSPEQFLSAKHVDFRADLWSLGVLAYRAVTGRLPFEATSFAALCIQIHRGVFPRASAYRADLTPNVDAWFTKALRGHPAARFASARQMAESFRAALTAPVDRPWHDSGRAPPPNDLARRHVANAKLARDQLSAGSDEMTVDMSSLVSGDGLAPSATLTAGDMISPRRRSTWIPALVGLALAIAAVAAVHPLEDARTALRSPPARAAAQVEPPEAPAPVASTSSVVELEPQVIVPNKSTGAPAPPRKTPPAVPSPPREPDRGF
jgi:serine/threonine-protein kinase